MGAFSCAPHGFLEWLHASGHSEVTDADFVPRAWFGAYLTATLAKAVATSTEASSTHLRDKVIGL